jgi:hypothetical protein
MRAISSSDRESKWLARLRKEVRERYGFLPYIEVEFVPEESGVLLRKRAHRSSPVEKVYGILKRKAKTDPILEALRGR